MARARVIQNSLNGGILSPTAFARVDINKYYSSIADGLNTNCHPHGGQFKRKGLKHIATLQGDGRLVKFAFNINQAYVLVFTLNNIAIYQDNTFIQNVTTTYTLEQIKVMGYTQSADTMIITHEDHIPRTVVRDSTTGTWSISDITLTNIPRYDYDGTLGYSFTNTGLAQTVDVDTGERVFNDDDDYGTKYHVYESLLDRTDVELSSEDYSNATNWTDLGIIEPVISETRGWPKYCTFYEARLWFAGLKSRPQTILGSVTNDFYNFDLGTSLDDECIFDTLDTDQVNPIVSIFPGRQLQVFTEGGEFSNGSKPITPSDSSWTRHTNYGSTSGIRNQLLDGTTMFIDRSGRNLREFIYSYTEEGYTSSSASTLAYDIINNPVDMTIIRGTDDDISNLVILINGDGTAAIFNTLRSEEVAGWTRWDTQGQFTSTIALYDDLYFIVSRDNGHFLEKATKDIYMDSFLEYKNGGPVIGGLSHLEGQEVQIVCDDSIMLPKTVVSGEVTTERAFTNCQVGLSYNAEVETLPISPNVGGGSSVSRHKRILKTTLRVYNTRELKINGETIAFRNFGTNVLDQQPEPFTGIKEIRHLGYGRLENIKIVSDTPTPFKLLSIENEVQSK